MPRPVNPPNLRIPDSNSAIGKFRNIMPTPCSRCRRQGEECLVDVRSGLCKNCNDSYKTCDLRVTFAEFERLAKVRKSLSRQSAEADDALDQAEEEVARAQANLVEVRRRARRLRKALRLAAEREDDAYERELASIEEVEKMTREAGKENPGVPETPPLELSLSLDELLAAGEILDIPDLSPLDSNIVTDASDGWGHVVGFSSIE